MLIMKFVYFKILNKHLYHMYKIFISHQKSISKIPNFSKYNYELLITQKYKKKNV